MEKTGDQQRLENESYAQWMTRLYSPVHYTEKGHDGERNRWCFRVPNDLAADAFVFMKKHDMSITTYLTFAMHHHINQLKNTNK